jgi:hypothetical protein
MVSPTNFKRGCQVEKEITKTNGILDVSHSCASKNCDSQATFFLKLTITNMAGWFCSKCANDLKSEGLANEVNKEIRHRSLLADSKNKGRQYQVE